MFHAPMDADKIDSVINIIGVIIKRPFEIDLAFIFVIKLDNGQQIMKFIG